MRELTLLWTFVRACAGPHLRRGACVRRSTHHTCSHQARGQVCGRGGSCRGGRACSWKASETARPPEFVKALRGVAATLCCTLEHASRWRARARAGGGGHKACPSYRYTRTAPAPQRRSAWAPWEKRLDSGCRRPPFFVFAKNKRNHISCERNHICSEGQ